MEIKLSELEELTGCEPGDIYTFAKKLAFKVTAWGDSPLPTNLNKNTVYFKLDDLDLVSRVWVNEEHIDFRG